LYSPQPEILSYLRKLGKEHHIYENTRFHTEVIQAAWIKERNQWKIDFRKVDQDKVKTLYFDIM
jgi:cation diffusion facilitator CzcD-associated flavoprotein CzcO